MEYLIVPNSTLVRDRIVNMTRPSRAANVRIEVGVSYDSDLDRVRAVLLAAAAEAPNLDSAHPPTVLFTRFGDLSVQVATVFRVTDYKHLGTSRSFVQEQIHRRFREEGIQIPTLPRDAGSRPPAAQAKEA